MNLIYLYYYTIYTIIIIIFLMKKYLHDLQMLVNDMQKFFT